MNHNTVNYLRRKKAAEYLQKHYGAYTEKTLAKLASIGGGPRFQKMGAYPLYRPEDLREWAESRISHAVFSTSELNRVPVERA